MYGDDYGAGVGGLGTPRSPGDTPNFSHLGPTTPKGSQNYLPSYLGASGPAGTPYERGPAFAGRDYPIFSPQVARSPSQSFRAPTAPVRTPYRYDSVAPSPRRLPSTAGGGGFVVTGPAPAEPPPKRQMGSELPPVQTVYQELNPASDTTDRRVVAVSPSGSRAMSPPVPAFGATMGLGGVDPFVASQAMSPMQADFYQSERAPRGIDRFDERWVTIFGFSPSSTSYVLRQFQNYGEIVRHVKGSGNWIYVMYRQPIQAKKALSKNGKVLDGKLMIGVAPGADQESVLAADPSASLIGSPTSPRAAVAPQTPSRLPLPGRTDYEVDPATVFKKPVASRSFVQKTMEYIFGW